ncbi:MAG: hypothetical protein ACRD0A_04940 [Acidimicrobiales bacterium]
MAAACTEAGEPATPTTTTLPPATFHRVDAPSLRTPQPIPGVGGILGSSSLDPEWLVVGSMFDPESLSTTAAMWHSLDLRRGWKRADVRPVERGRDESFSDVARLGATRVAVGRVGDGADADGMVLVYDAEAWSRVDDLDLGGDGEQAMTAVAAGAEGVVASGLHRDQEGERSPRLWFSEDGIEWEITAGTGDEVFDAGGQEVVRAVAGGPGGFVAVGSDDAEDRSDALAWFSAEGRSWERVDLPGLSADRREALLSVAAHGSGFVATGYVADGAGQGAPASWVSTDGTAWTGPSLAFPLIDDGRSTTADLTASTVSSNGTTLAAGTGNSWRPHVWTSTDGITWTVRPSFTDEPEFAVGVNLTSVELAEGDLGVLGDSPLLLYPDGDRWVHAHTGGPMPIVGDRPAVWALATDGSSSVAVGDRWSPPGPASASRADGAAWTRDGAGTWTATPSRLEGSLVSVARYAGGWLAVGAESFVTSQARESDPNPDATIWVSPDGASWTRVLGETITPPIVEPVIVNDSRIPITDEFNADIMEGMRARNPPYSAALGGAGTQSLKSVTAFAGGFLAVGTSYAQTEAEPLVVVSPDGGTLLAERPGAGPGHQWLTGACVAADGTAAVVGSTVTRDTADVYAWRRDPGGGWAQATATDDSFSGPRDQVMSSCLVTAGGFVAVGHDGGDIERSDDAVVWTSPDGLTWRRVPDPDEVLGGENDQRATALVELPDGAVLVTIDDTRVDAGDVGLVRLGTDGALRRVDAGEVELRGRGQQSASGLTVVGSTVVIVGTDIGGSGVWEAALDSVPG